MRAVLTASFLIGISTIVAGCTTTDSGNTGNLFGGYVNPDMARACVNTGANKYYMPTNAIRAVNSQKLSNGSTQVTMKVDARDAICTISASGNVISFVDTTPKSADQVAAEAQLARK